MRLAFLTRIAGVLPASTMALGVLAGGLPSLAHAQFVNISQSGDTSVWGTVRDRNPQGDYTQPYSASATLTDLAEGSQTIKSTPTSGASASLTTSVGQDLIYLKATAQGDQETKNFYSTDGVLQHITNINLTSAAQATINFTLNQDADVTVSNLAPQTSWDWTNIKLYALDAQGASSIAYAGSSIFGANSLSAGRYSLSFNGSSSNGTSLWGISLMTTATVPEASTSALWAIGLAGLLLAGQRRRLSA